MTLSVTRFAWLAVAALPLLASCSKTEEKAAPANLITQNDFENLYGWVSATPSLTTEKAHSGRYSVKVDKDVEYGISYISLLGKASASRVQKLNVSGWVMTADPNSTASIVVQVMNPAQGNQQVFWDNIDLKKEVTKANEWTEVKKEFTLPANVEAGHELRIYMWRSGSDKPTYLDDLTITKGE